MGILIQTSDFVIFPRGCCGDTSNLLAQYLLENGIDSVYVCGNRYFDAPEINSQSHAWLMVDDFIVDITGDQFSNESSYYNYSQSVYVGKVDKFHKLFEVDERYMHDFYGIKSYEYDYQSRLSTLYTKIKEYL